MSTVTLDVADDVATIRLARPDARNAIDLDFVTALRDAVAGAVAPGAARAILVLADGPAFTVGGDLDHFTANAHRLGDELDTMVGLLHEALGDLAEAQVPIVCGVRGGAAGGGLGLLWAADVVIAGDDLKVATGFARLGLTGDGGWSYYLPRLIGMRRTQELVLENRILDAAEALEWGLITRVLPADEVDAAAQTAAAGFATGPTFAITIQRRLLRDSWGATVREQLAAELAAMRASGETADAVEGVTAFTQRRAPRFQGR